MKLPMDMPSTPKRTDRPVFGFALTADRITPQADWFKCAACCAGKAGFLACVARCMATGQACDGGLNNCTPC